MTALDHWDRSPQADESQRDWLKRLQHEGCIGYDWALRAGLIDGSILMPQSMVTDIKRHALERMPAECCGLIGGTETELTALARAANRAPDPEHTFMVDPFAQYKIEQAMTKAGKRIVAVYHSHCTTVAEPSRADLAGIPRHLLCIIYSLSHDELRAWSGEHEINIEVIPTTDLLGHTAIDDVLRGV